MSFAATSVATAVSAGGLALSQDAARSAGRKAGNRADELQALQVQRAEQQIRIANQLEEFARKLANDEPISPQERNAINAARKVADVGIRRATQEGIAQSIGIQQGTGFLRSGRTGKEISRLAIAGAEARGRVEAGREQALATAGARRQQLAVQALAAAAGGGIPQFQSFERGLEPGAILGAGLTALGGAGLDFAGSQNALSNFEKLLGGGVGTPSQVPRGLTEEKGLFDTPGTRFSGT